MHADEHAAPGMRIMYIIWGWLLAMTIIEVALAYFHLPLTLMLIVLMGLSLIKSVLIVAYFMHLKFERMSLVLTLIPALVMCILLLNVIFPDSLRVREQGVFRDLPPPTAGAEAAAGH
jgi:cytochrome c oxidase subunit 4